jgi:hypothetical protein
MFEDVFLGRHVDGWSEGTFDSDGWSEGTFKSDLRVCLMGDLGR